MEPTEAITDVDPAHQEGSERTGDGAREVVTRRYVRSPQDVLRLVVFGVASLLLIAATIWLEEAVVGVEEDIVALFGFLSPAIERVLNGSVEIVAALAAVLVFVVPLVTRRYRLFGYIFAANALAFVSMSGIQRLVDRETSPSVANELAERAGITNNGTSSGSIGLAQMAAAFIVLAPFVSKRWRRTGAVIVSLILLVRLLVSLRLPAEVFLALPVGAFCGALVLLAFGRPDRRPTLAAVAAALGDAGLPVSEVHPASVDARGSTPYFATMTDGTGLFVKVLGSQERAADLLFRVYRFIRFKNVGDDRPFSSLRRAIEHEALIALLARDVGIRTPRLRGIVDVGADSMLLAYEMIDGASLDGVSDDRVTDELMRSIWAQIEDLRSRRIAHRDLRRANVFVGSDDVPWIIDFGFSEAAVPQTILDADVAQMMASLSVVVGAERAAVAAIDVLGTDAVGEALPRLQAKALSGATQTALKQHPGLLEDLQRQVIDRCGVEQVEFVALERANRKTILMVVVLALATYFLFPQLADLPGIVDQVEDANWGWTPLIILASAFTYVGAAMGIAGSIPDRLPGGPLFMASVASSFASKLAPAGLGGMALNVRFLQKQGVDRAVAVSGVGLNTVGGIVGHVTLIGVFLVWAGRDAFGSFSLPDPKWFVVGLAIIAAMFLIGIAIPGTRRMMSEKLLPVLARAFDGVGEVLRRPSKTILLLGGSTLLTLAYLTTLYLSIAAFGGGLPFATVGAVYLVGSAVAQAAPTPGGLGAMEAALISGLVAAGLDDTIAVPAVFLYRLFTFWVPVLPGWLSFQWLQRHEYL
ncbi:lysylphosphatidylglycerol synthase transmembrane domain-containing protein [Ilumatobacter nonamiensis]|uniref:lysylphosphatidylglycerol synthase transmembrane domain-containing protein n=1 Tax=Ilumatobacter nonamiensis TaxID=467093 RepID=UPI00058F491C|nr:lysylphosphatidylglycerol synthase transmembrane domain-containing protein [Ilumatobacter nonamiensis]